MNYMIHIPSFQFQLFLLLFNPLHFNRQDCEDKRNGLFQRFQQVQSANSDEGESV